MNRHLNIWIQITFQDQGKTNSAVSKCPLPTPRTKDGSPRNSYDNVLPKVEQKVSPVFPSTRDPSVMNQYDNAVPRKKCSEGKQRVSKEGSVGSVDSDDVTGKKNILAYFNSYSRNSNKSFGFKCNELSPSSSKFSSPHSWEQRFISIQIRFHHHNRKQQTQSPLDKFRNLYSREFCL